ncbi:MAG: hypothetical protein KME05_16940 [Gloeocapsa sp. UFS-A4-WI-NPMV-4B04]|nr:hypothetical protein [Gloeocapsa sp. UFS-A4-WI-NPMV-4B04]
MKWLYLQEINWHNAIKKPINLLIAISIVISPLWHGIKSVAAQEHPDCFLITQSGTLVELNNICIPAKNQQVEPLIFSGLEFQPPLVGLKAGEVRGAVTNRSTQVVPLKVIYIQLIADNRVIAASNILVETGSGLQPGESLSFDTVIGSKKVGSVPDEDVKVEVTRYE